MIRAGKIPTYSARVIDVISGDDLILMVDLSVDDLFKRVRARLRGVDTPDAYKQANITPAGAVRESVRAFTRKKECRVDVHTQGRGGWVVTLYVIENDEEISLNAKLCEEGFVYREETNAPSKSS